MATWPNLHVSQHPAVRHKLAILRDEQTEPKKFREVVRELSWLLGYEALADARTQPLEVHTPIEVMAGEELAERIGLIPILRAGLGMVDAMLELMPTAEVWHLGLFRDERTLRPVEYYNKLPDTATVDLCLILDPMLATGGSATAAIEVLKRWGAVTPVRIKLVNLIAAPEGVAAVTTAHPDVEIYTRRARPPAQREGLHHAGPGRRRRPPVRDRPLRSAGTSPPRLARDQGRRPPRRPRCRPGPSTAGDGRDVEPPLRDRSRRQRRPRLDAEAIEHAPQVALDGLGRDRQRRADLVVRAARRPRAGRSPARGS